YEGENFPGTRHILQTAGSGIIMLVGGTGLVAWAVQYVSTGQAAIMIATEPFWFLLLDKKNWRVNFTGKYTLIGLVIGFTGIVLFFLWNHAVPGKDSQDLHFTASLVLLGSAVAWVVGSLFAKNYPSPGSTFMNAGIQLFSAGICISLVALFTGEWRNFSIVEVPVTAWAGLLFLITFGSVVAYVSYVWLLSVRSPALVSTHTYVNPVVAVLLGWLFINETISGLQVLAMFIILVGVLLTNLRNYRKPVAERS
ncbi:MAG: EamA family transporter, partial [Chitinophagaceae bacterium]